MKLLVCSGGLHRAPEPAPCAPPQHCQQRATYAFDRPRRDAPGPAETDDETFLHILLPYVGAMSAREHDFPSQLIPAQGAFWQLSGRGEAVVYPVCVIVPDSGLSSLTLGFWIDEQYRWL